MQFSIKSAVFLFFALSHFLCLAQPANNTCANSILLESNPTCVLISSSFSGATMSASAPSCALSASQDVWFHFVATMSTHQIQIPGVNNLNSTIVLYSSCSSLPLICMNNSTSGATEQVLYNSFNVGQTYWIRVLNTSSNPSNITFNICVRSFESPTNNNCEAAQLLTPQTSCVNTLSSYSGSTTQTPFPSCGTTPNQDIWFQFVASENTNRITITGALYAFPGIEVYAETCDGESVTCQTGSVSGSGLTNISNNYIIGATYFIRVFNMNSLVSNANMSICIQEFPTPINNNCENAQEIIPGLTCEFTQSTFAGSNMNSGAPSCEPIQIQDVWFKFTATTDNHQIRVSSSAITNEAIEVFRDSCGGELIYCGNNATGSAHELAYLQGLTIGETYVFRIYNSLNNISIQGLNVCIESYPSPSNNACIASTLILPDDECTVLSGTFAGSSNSSVESCEPLSSQDVWYEFVANASSMSVELFATPQANYGFQIFKDSCDGLLVHCENQFGINALEYMLLHNFVVGESYFLRLFNAQSSLVFTNYNFCIKSFTIPENNDCSNSILINPIEICTTVGGSFYGANTLSQGNTFCQGSNTQDVWYSFVAQHPTQWISLSDYGGLQLALEVYALNCNGSLLGCATTEENDEILFLYNQFTVGATYYIRVLNTSITYSTENFNLCLQTYPIPENNTCNTGLNVMANSVCLPTNSTFAGSNFSQATGCGNVSASQDVWFTFTPNLNSNQITVATFESLNFGFEIYTELCSGNLFHCQSSIGSTNEQSWVSNDFLPGTPYWIRVFNHETFLTTSNFTLCIEEFQTPVNNTCSNASLLIPFPSCVPVFANLGGSSMSNQPSCGLNSSQDLWYYFQATQLSMSIVLSTNSGADFGFQVFKDSCDAAPLFCINNQPAGFGESLNYNQFVNGSSYFIRVFNASEHLTNAGFQICILGAAPPTCETSVMMTSNLGSTICQNDIVTFYAVAINASSNTNYQWKVNGLNVPGNLSTLTTQFLSHGDVVTCAVLSPAQCASPDPVLSPPFTISVVPYVSPTFSFSNSYCINSEIPNLPTTSDNGISGTWSPALNNTQSTVYQFVPSVGQCATHATKFISIQNYTEPFFPAYAPVCSGANMNELPSISLDGAVGSWTPEINNLQTTTYTFTPENVTDNFEICFASVELTIQVNDLIEPAFNLPDTICSGSTPFLFPSSSNNGISGSWFPTFNNEQTTTYVFTPAANTWGCYTETSYTIQVLPLPQIDIDYVDGMLVATAGLNAYEWYFNNILLNNANTNTIEPILHGNYTLVVTDVYGCSSTQHFGVNNIDAVRLFGDISFYPNPVTSNVGNLNIESALNTDIQLVLFDTKGKKLVHAEHQLNIGQNTFPIDLTHFAVGIYFLSIQVNEFRSLIKVVVE